MNIFVTGATGTVGQHVVKKLVEKGVGVRALTRCPEKTDFPQEVEVIKGDLMEPETFSGALEGIDGLYLITSSDKVGADLTTNPKITDLAEQAGVKKVALLSVYGGEQIQDAIKTSSMEWTFIQAVGFMANALEMNGWKESIEKGEAIKELGLHERGAIIHEEDIASVVVSVLLEDGHHEKTYTLTGPEALSPAEQLEMMSEVLDKAISFEELSVEEARGNWKKKGYTEEDIAFFIEMALNTPEIGYTVVPTVEEITGKPAKTFRQWVEEHKKEFNA